MIEETKTERWKRKTKQGIEAAILFIILMYIMQDVVQPVLMSIDILAKVVMHDTLGDVLYLIIICIFGGLYYMVKDIIKS